MLVVSHYFRDIPCKKFNYIFAFVKVMSKLLSECRSLFFQTQFILVHIDGVGYVGYCVHRGPLTGGRALDLGVV